MVSWSPPETFENGRPIHGPLGYRVYYGQSFGNYPSTVEAGERTQVTIDGLRPGNTYYFVITAYTMQGAESKYSRAVAIRVLP